jgi:hypothetical protein
MQLLGFESAELVGIVSRPQAEWLKNYGLIPSKARRFLSSLQHQDWAWSPPNPLFIGYCGIFYQAYRGQGMDGGKCTFTLPKLLLL